jgi:Uma2 family endonuclease
VQPEIVLPETKPETEWVRGRPLQKVSPAYRHAKLQRMLATAIGAWADDGRFGRVGSEWRFRVVPPGEIARPLVPNVAYLSYASLPVDADEEAQIPFATPTVAVEILSPGDGRIAVAHKIAVYLRAGTSVVLVVDPKSERIEAHDARRVADFEIGTTFAHAAMPGLTIDVASLFAKAKI